MNIKKTSPPSPKSIEANPIPCVRDTVRGDDLLVWCEYCRKNHVHSAVGLEGGPTPRVAHCYVESPYNSTGYWILPIKEGVA